MKQRLLAELPVRDLSEFRFTPAEFENIDLKDGGRELERDGFLYDLVRIERIADGSIIVHALRDDRETKVLATLDGLLDQLEEKDNQGKDQRTHLVSSWAPFCELVPTMAFFSVARDRGFPELTFALGRTADAIEPGPPRAA